MMERLTKRGNYINNISCIHYDSKECIEADGNCYAECEWEEAVWSKLAEYEDLEEQGLLLRLPCKVGEAIDKLFSHNEFIALWYDKLNDKDHSYLLWKGMAHQLPKEYGEQRILKFKGIIPERFSEADTINLLVTPYIIPCEEAEQKLKEMEDNARDTF